MGEELITRKYATLLQESVATFSDCERYRYVLERIWDARLPKLCYLMMNPSTATEVDNDPTIERCQRRAVKLGFGAITIVNMFPFRETYSSQLGLVPDLIGDPDHADSAITQAVKSADLTICGWGEHTEVILPRVRHVINVLKENGLSGRLYALHINKDGSPQHPLYVGYDKQPIPWNL